MHKRVLRLSVLGFVVGDVDHNGRIVKEELVSVPVQLLWPFNFNASRLVEEVEGQLNEVTPTED